MSAVPLPISCKFVQVLSESITWMATAVEEFGLGTIDVKALIDNMKVDLASTNATIKNAAINLLSVAHKQLGSGLADMLRSDVKPALMTALEDVFKRNPQEQVCFWQLFLPSSVFGRQRRHHEGTMLGAFLWRHSCSCHCKQCINSSRFHTDLKIFPACTAAQQAISNTWLQVTC